MNNPKDFAEAIGRKVTRPFSFGPIKFKDLHMDNSGFDLAATSTMIIDKLESHSTLGRS